MPTITSKSFTRRTVLFGGVGLLASGCIESPVISNFASVMRSAAFGGPDLPLKREAVTKLPYASMTARVGRGPQDFLVLGKIDGRDQHWVASDKSILVIRGGRLVRTVGFNENLLGTIDVGEDPVDKQLHVVENGASYTRLVDMDFKQSFGVPIDSTFEVLGDAKIEIVELTFDTIVVRERSSVRTFQWDFENIYWVDPEDGFVWRSRQHFTRSLPPITYDVLKPVG